MSRSGFQSRRRKKPLTQTQLDALNAGYPGTVDPEVAAKRAADELAAKALCATCGLPRSHADHQLTAQSLRMVRCQFVEPHSEGAHS